MKYCDSKGDFDPKNTPRSGHTGNFVFETLYVQSTLVKIGGEIAICVEQT